MSTFIVRLELHPSDLEQAGSAVHRAMEAAGFSRIFTDYDGIRYHLPSFEYCRDSAGSSESVRTMVQQAVGKITSLFMLLVSDTKDIAIAGLVPVKETSGRLEYVAPSVVPTIAGMNVERSAFASHRLFPGSL